MRKIGGVNMNAIARLTGKLTKDKTTKRYCSVYESLEQSLKEMKLIREGKLKATTWDEFKKQLESEED